MKQWLSVIIGIIASLLLGMVSNWVYDVLKKHGKVPDKPSNKQVVIIIAVALPLIFLVALSQIASIGATQIEFDVVANKTWQNTELRIEPGDTVTVSYIRGEWTIDTNGPNPEVNANGYGYANSKLNDLPYGALIGRIGSDEPFFIGNESKFISHSTGTLALQINDGLFSDKGGSVTVKIIVSH